MPDTITILPWQVQQTRYGSLRVVRIDHLGREIAYMHGIYPRDQAAAAHFQARRLNEREEAMAQHATLISVTLFTADDCTGTSTVVVYPDGPITESHMVWDDCAGIDGTPDEHTTSALIETDEYTIDLDGDQWRTLEGELNLDAFYRALAAGNDTTIDAMIAQASCV